MDGAFAVRDQWRTRIDGARVLLVDDVMTTGATLSACAEACRAAGAALVFARVAREPWTPIFEANPNGDEDETEHETG
jgi:adenine/guanine phosphoribosyltransferase-like PRPP-binding protein